jgi:hypothetical protein
MPVIQGGLPSWLQGGKTVIIPGQKPQNSSTADSKPEEKPSAQENKPPDPEPEQKLDDPPT